MRSMPTRSTNRSFCLKAIATGATTTRNNKQQQEQEEQQQQNQGWEAFWMFFHCLLIYRRFLLGCFRYSQKDHTPTQALPAEGFFDFDSEQKLQRNKLEPEKKSTALRSTDIHSDRICLIGYWWYTFKSSFLHKNFSLCHHSTKGNCPPPKWRGLNLFQIFLSHLAVSWQPAFVPWANVGGYSANFHT